VCDGIGGEDPILADVKLVNGVWYYKLKCDSCWNEVPTYHWFWKKHMAAITSSYLSHLIDEELLK
jgi:hypothetical protein